jgi:hypothetical protein
MTDPNARKMPKCIRTQVDRLIALGGTYDYRPAPHREAPHTLYLSAPEGKVWSCGPCKEVGHEWGGGIGERNRATDIARDIRTDIAELCNA